MGLKCPDCGNGLTAYCVRPAGDGVSRHFTCICGWRGRSIEQLVPPGVEFKRRHLRVDGAGVVRWKVKRQSVNSL